MVGDTVITVIGMLLASAITAGATVFATKYQQSGENTRRRAEFYIQKKVDLLTSLHELFVELNYLLGSQMAVEEQLDTPDEFTHQESQKANELLRQIEHETKRVRAFLDSEDYQTVRKALWIASAASLQRSPTDELDTTVDVDLKEGGMAEIQGLEVQLSDFSQYTNEAIEVLESELNEAIFELKG